MQCQYCGTATLDIKCPDCGCQLTASPHKPLKGTTKNYVVYLLDALFDGPSRYPSKQDSWKQQCEDSRAAREARLDVDEIL